MVSPTAYHGGRLLTNVGVLALWVEVDWKNGTTSRWNDGSLRCTMDEFLQTLVASNFMYALGSHFSVPGKTIGTGTVVGNQTFVIGMNGNGPIIDDYDIQMAINDALLNDTVSADANTCLMLFVPPAVTVTNEGGTSKHDFGGYHGLVATSNGIGVAYCVVAPIGENLDELTANTSHELAEAITDSDGQGWNGEPDALGRPQEICDLCLLATVTMSGFEVSTFATDAPRPGTHVCAPAGDTFPRPQFSAARIDLDKSVPTTCATGSIIEGHPAIFHARAFYQGAATQTTKVQWATQSGTGPLIATTPADAMTYAVDVPVGQGNFDVLLTVTTKLGCTAEAQQAYRVSTTTQAEQENVICALSAKIRELEREKFPRLPWLPAPPPWRSDRDLVSKPPSLAELHHYRELARAILAFTDAEIALHDSLRFE